MQSVKARKALLDDTILDCTTLESGIFSFILPPATSGML